MSVTASQGDFICVTGQMSVTPESRGIGRIDVMADVDEGIVLLISEAGRCDFKVR
jgi:hypothetical protein